jgi:hypothetical protein
MAYGEAVRQKGHVSDLPGLIISLPPTCANPMDGGGVGAVGVWGVGGKDVIRYERSDTCLS